MFSLRNISAHLGLLGILLAAAVGAYAFTASNTVPTTQAGDGSATVGGYTLSAIHYGLNATTASNIDSLTFTLDSAPASGSALKIKISGNWYGCTNSSTSVTCTTTSPQLTLPSASALEALVAD